MMATFAKPENALKRADELINVGKKIDALQALRDLITSKRYKAWQKPHEQIMFKYIELCVELRKGRFAKDGLIQYRIVCQQVNVTSLEEVIKHFIHLATEKAEQARNQAQSLDVAIDVKDLDVDEWHEDKVVTPWFKFLWETYRTVLEILRNNSKLETLYAMTAHRTFQFCKKYKRTTEFRRLCEIIRNHLANLNKYRDQRDRPDLSSPESLQLYVDTRFEQLKIATELGLWQESFRTIEDIHGLMSMVKKTPKPSLMVVYYAKLTTIFRVSNSHLYHAYAWFKLFSLQKVFNKNISQRDLQLIASSVVLSALSVPTYDRTLGASHLDIENDKERNLRMTNLIGFNLDPKHDGRELLSRSSLLLELVSKGVMTCVTPEVKELYHILEHEFLPLELASKVEPLLTKISKIGGKLLSASSVPEVQLSQYIPSLEKLATLRLLQQVSLVYQTMKIETLSKMIPYFDFSVVEKLHVQSGKNTFTVLKFDHGKGAVCFVNLGLESEELRDHLTNLAGNLNGALTMLYPPTKKASKLGDMLPSLADKIDREHRRLLARKSVIEKRKEEHERHLLEMEREEESKRLKLLKITEEAEQKRLASESEQRKNLRILREIEERELEEAQALFLEAEKRSKKKGKKPNIEGEKVTKESLMELARSEQAREREETEKKLQKIGKTMDYLERAKREEAAPLIEAAFQLRLVEEREIHERKQQQEIELSMQCHDGDLKEKSRLSRMMENKIAFQEKIIRIREEECNRVRREKEERLAEIIRQRSQERETKRKMLFYLKSEEERLTKLREEEEARKREELERRKKEEVEHKAKQDEIAEKQRQRERETEEKERLRKESVLGRTAVPAPGTAAPAAVAVAVAAPLSTGATRKYVPPNLKQLNANANAMPPPADTDRWDRAVSAGSDKRRGPLPPRSTTNSWSNRYPTRG